MSCSLFWKPPGKGHRVGDARLRNAIERKFGRRATLDCDAREFIDGLVAAGVDGAEELLRAIDQHGSIEVYQEC